MQARIKLFGPFERVFLLTPPPVERTLRKRVNIGGDAFLLVLSKTAPTRWGSPHLPREINPGVDPCHGK
jgi:hypothetical protein